MNERGPEGATFKKAVCEKILMNEKIHKDIRLAQVFAGGIRDLLWQHDKGEKSLRPIKRSCNCFPARL